MSNNILERTKNQLRSLNEEKHQLNLQIIGLEINLHLTDRTTRKQTEELRTIRDLGIKLIEIDRSIEECQHIIERASTHQQN